jgi:prolyl-tRNA synthetase
LSGTLLRQSVAFSPTLKEVPKEAEIASHVLMLRAGLIRMVSSGLYTYLPLGLRVIHKVENIVREEMNRAGAQEILGPSLHPDELWKRSGRWEIMGPELMRLKDRNDREFVLGPTAEEIFTDLVAGSLSSYRELPKNLYQIQTKFRDETRPRFGIMRAREFIMKDAYSFDRDDEGCEKSYWAMYESYARIFLRCALDFRPVEADTGVMGGKVSHEFMALADTGEAEIAICRGTDFAVNLEVCEVAPEAPPTLRPDVPERELVDTPNRRTIDEVTRMLEKKPEELIKTLLFQSGEKTVAVLVRGDRDANPIKVSRAMGGLAELADNKTVKEVTGCEVGFAGPIGLPKEVEVWADPETMAMTEAVTGANQTGKHYLHVVPGRDFEPTDVLDLRFAVEGDRTPQQPGAPIRIVRGIEVGQVFKLGTKYSESMDATFQDEDGSTRPMVMGCYGIGVTRTVAAIVEQHHDDKGIVWPASVAPFDVHLIAVGGHEAEIGEACDTLAQSLCDRGFDVLYDDREERPGVKFKDADLMGIPWQVSLGKKAFSKGVCEITSRSTGVRVEVSLTEAANHLASKRETPT